MIYYKISGAAIIFAACVAWGVKIVKDNNSETNEIKKTIRFYEDYKNEINYNSCDVSAAIINSIKNNNFIHKNAFAVFAKQLSEGNASSFTDAWNKCLKTDFSKSTIQILNNFCCDLRQGDVSEYKLCADKQIEILNNVLTSKLKENKKNNKLAVYISALTGIFLILVLI